MSQKQFELYEMGYAEALSALRSKQFYRRARINLIDIHRPGVGGVVARPDLPWLDWPWMAYFLTCLEAHGREDCQCWRVAYDQRAFVGTVVEELAYGEWQRLLQFGDPYQLDRKPMPFRRRQVAYRGTLLSESRGLRGTVYDAAWRRERSLATSRYEDKHGKAEDPDILIPWSKAFFFLLETGQAKSPADAAKKVGQRKPNISLYRNTKPWFNERLEALGFPRMPWMSKGWRAAQEKEAWKKLKEVQV